MSTFYLNPSSYEWLLPDVLSNSAIDNMAAQGLFPKLLDLYPSILFAAAFGIARLILFEVLFKPVAIWVLKLHFSNQSRIDVIDKYIASLRSSADRLTDETSAQLSEKTGLNKSQIKRYIWNTHRDEVNRKKIVKFGEAMWRALFYTSFTVLGYITLCHPEYAIWLQKTSHNFEDWPNHPITGLMNFYYQIELGCYLHQLHWTEVTRSDAFEMILHHLITITLIVASYMTNFTRIGTSILLTHDIADVFLEIGKCFNYISKVPESKPWASPVTDAFFGCFAVSFFITRLVVYPRYMVYSLVVEAPQIMGMWSGYWLFATMLVGLQCLHVFWFYLIARMIYRLVIVGEVEKDVRSDDEDAGDEPMDETTNSDKKEN